ncbi:MAG: hypothetical protein D6739_03190 [Nitrospirae bacterium]|nr:MAG: hypothetical protein D6739_03190 [Nitrospirota bacterium]
MAQTHRVAIVGCGRVGATTAFALLHTGLVEELVLVDRDRARAEGEAMDLAHATPLLAPARVWAGELAEAAAAEIVILAAGRASATRDESRLALVEENARITEAVVGELAAAGFAGCLLVATNPVDVLARIACEASGLPAARVIGSGTLLDTARLRHRLAAACGLDPRSVHARSWASTATRRWPPGPRPPSPASRGRPSPARWGWRWTPRGWRRRCARRRRRSSNARGRPTTPSPPPWRA